MISNLGRLEKLTSQVQENGVAMKQAATNMDTLDQATIEAKNAWDNMLLSFTSGDFGEVIKGFVKKATIGLNELKISLSGIGTLLSTGSIFQAAENTADQRMKDFIKLTVSQMTKATREKVLAQEKIEAEAMIKAIKNVKNVSEEELKIYSKNIQSKIFLIKEIEKYQNKSSKESIAANTDEGSKIVAIDEETKKKLIDNFKKLQETLDQLEHEHQLAKMSDDDRELQLIHDKYNKLRKDAKGHSEELKRIQALEDEDIFDLIVKKFAKEGEAETKGYFDRLKRLEQLEKQKTKITDTGNSGSKNLSEAEKFKAESKKLAEEFDNRIAEAKAFKRCY